MNPDEDWPMDARMTHYDKWKKSYTLLPHISEISGGIIWPFNEVFYRRVLRDFGIIRFEWITEKEYLILILRGKENGVA